VHEFSIAEALLGQVLKHGPAGARISGVRIRVGALRGLEPEALQMSWTAVTIGSAIEGAVLEVDQLPWAITCSSCGRVWESRVPFVSCECGNDTPAPVGGDELEIVSLTIDEEEAP
jgi:hydrogenase nickel incorporation protein HypA/HybF